MCARACVGECACKYACAWAHVFIGVCPYVWMHAWNSVGTWVYERNGDLCAVPARPSQWTRPVAGHLAGRPLHYSCHPRPNHFGMQSGAFTLPNFMACWSLLLVFTRGRHPGQPSPEATKAVSHVSVWTAVPERTTQLSALTELNVSCSRYFELLRSIAPKLFGMSLSKNLNANITTSPRNNSKIRIISFRVSQYPRLKIQNLLYLKPPDWHLFSCSFILVVQDWKSLSILTFRGTSFPLHPLNLRHWAMKSSTS